jgi:hypothetical protein
MVIKIISGGQTGADRAALDWAIRHGIRHEGSYPKGRGGENGEIPPKYKLTELSSESYADQIERNILDSDGTLLLTEGSALTEASALTAEYCQRHRKPLLRLIRSAPRSAARLASFVEKHQIFVLNITGCHSSSARGMESFVDSILSESSQIFLLPHKNYLFMDHPLPLSETSEKRATGEHTI